MTCTKYCSSSLKPLMACFSIAVAQSDSESGILKSTKIGQPIEHVWPKILKFLALKSISLNNIDKNAGIISATGPITPGVQVDCSHNKGRLTDYQYNLAISVDIVGESQTSVTVMLNGDAKNLSYRHFLMFRTTRVKTPVACQSKGAFEKELFEFLVQE